ncbi:hypothetical protein PanWU01x14_193670 [Parasponia andersonii]|uniref:Uncharacterized protein n=1 Tax=Parasponia andersonii TaxID=3476 RepID=A0A2P5C0T6_PARAD|nr:hypothetical protein PanWU01x14_193670 [Parasponia andersonii]
MIYSRSEVARKLTGIGKFSTVKGLAAQASSWVELSIPCGGGTQRRREELHWSLTRILAFVLVFG